MNETMISPPIWFAIQFSFVCMAIAIMAGIWRLLKGPSLPDRIIVLDLMASIVVAMILTYVIYSRQPVFMNVAVTISLIVFMGTVAFARYLKKRMCND